MVQRVLSLIAVFFAISILILSSNIPINLVQADEQDRCFPETGYCISGPIRAYWENNGGLPVFGFPITPQRNETVEGTWTGPVQWFERDRLEDHGNEGVMAGRLGADILERAETPWRDFPTVDQASDNCRYFEITRHSLCEPFLSYWQDNGGLERFGFPITESFEATIQDWTGTIQYFERRRMEHHTEYSGTPYEVLLGLLGNEVRSIGTDPKPPVTVTPTPTETTPPTATSTPIPSTPTSTATSTPAPDMITLTKMSTVSQAQPGQEIEYLISVQADYPQEQTVTVIDNLDVHLEPLEATAGNQRCQITNQQVHCSVPVRAGSSANVQIRTRVRDNATNNTLITNVANATSGGDSATSDPVVINVFVPSATSTPNPTNMPIPATNTAMLEPTNTPIAANNTATPKPTNTSLPATDTPIPTPSVADYRNDVVEYTNQYRRQNGCNDLQLDDQLTQAAQQHSEDMAINDYFSHDGLNGSTPWDRIKATGYTYSNAAENIYAGSRTPKETVEGWFASDGHRKNMLNCDLEYIGVGYYYLENDTGSVNYHTYWVQVFATP